MRIIRLTYQETNPVAGLCLCLGFFDGIHRAHQQLLSLTLDKARELGVPAGVVTFSTHILSFLRHDPFRALSTINDKIHYARSLGFDYFFILTVSLQLTAMSPETFIEQYLAKAAHIVVGYDYTYGYRGVGTPELMEEALPGRVSILPRMDYYRLKVGSTRIRSLLEKGRISTANRLLKRPYQVRGTVIAGHGRGRKMGYPTANLDYDGYLLPKNGVYHTNVLIDNLLYDAMTSIGTNPTFSDNSIRLETHVFDFCGDLYGKEINIMFLRYLRPEKRFSSVTDLIEELKKDEEHIRRIHALERG
jgi:riboflavin kinase/FMN adenylyltransferase